MNWERVQENALRNILKDKYENYENARRILKIKTLYERRENLVKNFGKKCIQLEQTKGLFPLNERNQTMQTRNQEKYKILTCKYRKIEKLHCTMYKQNIKQSTRKTELTLTYSALLPVKSCYALCITVWLQDCQ